MPKFLFVGGKYDSEILDIENDYDSLEITTSTQPINVEPDSEDLIDPNCEKEIYLKQNFQGHEEQVYTIYVHMTLSVNDVLELLLNNYKRISE